MLLFKNDLCWNSFVSLSQLIYKMKEALRLELNQPVAKIKLGELLVVRTIN